MQITTVLNRAAPRVVTPRSGANPFTLYELFDHEGTAWTVKSDVYNQAQGWIGMTVDMVVRVEQNGSYTNRYADIVTPNANGQVPASNAVVQAMQAAQAQQRVQPSVPQMPNTQQITPQAVWQPGMDVPPTEKDKAIHRQVAAKVAAQISTSATEFWANCVDLARYFDSGQTPDMDRLANPQSELATAGAGYVNSPPPPGDDDIPF